MILTLIHIYLLVYLFIEFEPIQNFIDNFFMNYFDTNEYNGSFKHFTLNSLWVLTGCMKCLMFWTTLIVTLNIYAAVVLMSIAKIQKYILSKFK